ncbi:MAG TPA: hypothetical protein VKE53_00285 [Pseudolabrys sp.]|nr:hypothetical protein [Pseudolabrys sp.]
MSSTLRVLSRDRVAFQPYGTPGVEKIKTVQEKSMPAPAWRRKRKSLERANDFRFPSESSRAQRADHDGRLVVCGDQWGRTSAPMRLQAVQTILGHKDRTGISSGRASTFMTAL